MPADRDCLLLEARRTGSPFKIQQKISARLWNCNGYLEKIIESGNLSRYYAFVSNKAKDKGSVCSIAEEVSGNLSYGKGKSVSEPVFEKPLEG